MANRRSRFFSRFIPVRLRESPLQGTPEWLAIVLMLAIVVLTNGTVALAQELDSGQLQKEAAAQTQQKQTSDSAAQQGQPASSPIQPQNTQPQNTQPQTSGPPSSPLTLPAGTKLPLGLLRPLKLKPGKDVYLQATFPVTVGNQMVIPPGTYVQGVVTKIIRKDRRRYSIEFEIGSANLIFSNGYTVPIAGVVTVATTYASLQSPRPSTGDGQSIPAMAAVGSTTTPTLPGIDPNFGSGVKKAMIAVGVIAGAATVAAIVFALRSDPYLEAGTPLQIILPAPVSLDPDRVMAAIQQYDQQTRNAPPQIVQPPVRPRTCYEPGTPGTPDTVIPGTPGTPPNGDFPGTPGTPDTVIPGTPGTPGRSYPCPR